MRELTFGQFYPVESFVHKMDARAKIILTTLFIVSIFMVKNPIGFVYPFLFLALSVMSAKVPLRSILKSIKPIMFLVIFTAVLNLFFYSQGNVVFKFGFIKIYDEAISFTVFMAIRLLLLVMGSSILTLTTQPVELTDAIESLFKPLNVIKFPVHELALIMSIALRFIPTLMDEADRIIRAQKARGADFESGNLISRAKALLPILIPLLVSSFRRAEELADAMDSRCYSGGKNRTKMKQLKYGGNDIIAALYGISMLMFVIMQNALV